MVLLTLPSFPKERSILTRRPRPTAASTPVATAMDPPTLEMIEELTINARKIQEELLAEILSANKDTEYLRSFDLCGATDPETFKAKVPVIEYGHLKPYVKRIAEGDRSAVLVADPVIDFLTSSGTSSGERKLIPNTQEYADRRSTFSAYSFTLVNSCMPGYRWDQGKALSFLFASSETSTPAGHPVRQASTSFLKSERAPFFLQTITSPIEAVLCLDFFQSMYAQILCGLCQRDVVNSVHSIFASGLLRAIRFLQLHYQELAHDISTGSLSSRITDASLRAAVSRLLEPNPDLGELLLRECSTGNWEGIVRRIWPKARYVGTIVTGSMAKYIPDVEHYGGGLPVLSIGYGSSESYFGINLSPLCKPSEVTYTIMPNMAYFEFLPLDPEEGGELRPVDYGAVEVGKEYDLVVTTHAGLYRYGVGDVVRVTGFHNEAPQVQVLRRKNAILSVGAETTDEVELQRGVDSVSRLLDEFDVSIVDYTSNTDIKVIPGHYVIYLELLSKDSSMRPSVKVMERCCMAIEEELNARYRQGRVEHGSIGPLEIRSVREGTFDKLVAHAVSMGTSASMYKVPRCVCSPAIVELLDSCVVSSHFSSGLPTWKGPV